MAGLNNVPTDEGTSSDKKTTQASPRGIPKKRAPKVTQKELTIIGKMPNKPLLGIHFTPKRKALGPIFKIRGRPPSKMKKSDKGQYKNGGKSDQKEDFFNNFLSNSSNMDFTCSSGIFNFRYNLLFNHLSFHSTRKISVANKKKPVAGRFVFLAQSSL
jgi:hypothetical protein